MQSPNGVWNIFGGKLAWGPEAIVCDDPNFQGRGNPSSGMKFYLKIHVYIITCICILHCWKFILLVVRSPTPLIYTRFSGNYEHAFSPGRLCALHVAFL